MKTTMTWVVGTLVALTISIPAVAHSQERVGVATTVVGPVTITHVAASPAPLKFKDDVLLNDRVTTGDNGFARMLLGGKAIVTARERSIITITEAPGVSTIDLVSGRISVAVDKSRVRPGEVVEIKTPNAISGIRGTIVVAEVNGGVSTITVLRGLVDVYRRDPATGKAVGPATPVGVRESVTVKGGVLPARPQSVSADNARRLSSDFTAPVHPISPGSTMPVAEEVTRATNLIGTLTGGTPGAGVGAPATTSTKATTGTTTTLAPTTTLTPTTALTPLPTLSTVPTLGTVPTLSTAPTTPTVPKVAQPTLTMPILPSNTPLR
jgi:hypothetical protein